MPYTKFGDDATSVNSVPVTLPHQPPTQQPTFLTENAIAEICRKSKILAVVEMAISCVLLLFGFAAVIMSTQTPYWYGDVNTSGSAIWAPILGIVTAGLGLGALNRGDYSRGCLLVAHFVMCIVSALGFGIAVIFAVAAACSTSSFMRWYRYSLYNDDRETASMALPISLLVVEVIIILLSLAASKLPKKQKLRQKPIHAGHHF